MPTLATVGFTGGAVAKAMLSVGKNAVVASTIKSQVFSLYRLPFWKGEKLMCKQTVTMMFKLYIERSQLRESSIEIKSRAAELFVKWFGDLSIDKVGYGHAEDYRNLLLKERNTTSVNIYIQNFKSFWAWLVKRGYIDKNPFADIKMLPSGRQRIKPFTPDEIERILKVADNRWKAIVLLGLASMRRAEVLNLVVSDIYFDKDYICINPKKDTLYTWQWDIKNYCNEAIVLLPEMARNLLLGLIEELPVKQPYVFLTPERYQGCMRLKLEGKLTHRIRNCPWGNFSRDFRNLQRRAKVIPTRRFHDLRGTFATTMSQYLSLTDVQRLMRHASSNTTAQYYIKPERQKLVAKANGLMDKILCVE